VNFYSPQDTILSLNNIPTFDTNFFSVGDFTSHSQRWGYDQLDNRGDEVETWQDDKKLILINKLDDQQTFYFRRWHTTTNSYLAFCLDVLHGHTTREVYKQVAVSNPANFEQIYFKCKNNSKSRKWRVMVLEQCTSPQ